jgi:uncharacterized membrane protein YoaK (UPF0700 family)
MPTTMTGVPTALSAWEDWIWYVALPVVVYVALVVVAVFLRTYVEVGLFAVAAIALALLLIGIHNAWDTVNASGPIGRPSTVTGSAFTVTTSAR